MDIPFNKIYYTGKEQDYLQDALKRKHLSGDGFYTKQVSRVLEERFNINRVLMTTSGTHALEMAVKLMNIASGDEVIMPSFTFPSTANAVIGQGGKPVFAEIKRDTLNIDPDSIEKMITAKTKAIIVVHYAGIGCEMNKIMKIAGSYNLSVIEDAAQAVNAKYKDKHLGTWGDIGCYSFHESKNYISGEGGALAINVDDKRIYNRAEIIREKGTNRANFIRGEVDKYTWVDEGSSYIPSDLLMAVLYAQLEKLDLIKLKRKEIYNYYYDQLEKYLHSDFLAEIPTIPRECKSNYHIFYLVFKNNKIRERVLEELQKKDISATFHYIPLHLSPMGKKLGYRFGDLPLTEESSSSLIRLPLYTGMKEQEREYIIKSITEIFEEF